MDLTELATMLRERGLVLQIEAEETGEGRPRWIATLTADDDPELGEFWGDGWALDAAVAMAFDAWDNAGAKEVFPPPIGSA